MQREKQAPYGEPDVGLNPRTLGSWPEPKVDTQPLSHPGAPRIEFLMPITMVLLYKLDFINGDL